MGLSGNSVRVFLGVRLSAAENFAKPENVSPMSHQNYKGLPHAAQINENLKANFYKLLDVTPTLSEGTREPILVKMSSTSTSGLQL